MDRRGRPGRIGHKYLTALRRFEEAEAQLLEPCEIETKALGPDHKFTQKVTRYLAELYDAWGYPDKAAEYRASTSTVASNGEESDGDAGHTANH